QVFHSGTPRASFCAHLPFYTDPAASAPSTLSLHDALPILTGLVQRLDLHGIGEIALPAEPPPPQLFELFRALADQPGTARTAAGDRKSTRLNSSHQITSYSVFCLKKKTT